MDVAASEFHKEGKYDLDFKNKDSDPEKWISPDQLCEMYKGFVNDFPGTKFVVLLPIPNFKLLLLG